MAAGDLRGGQHARRRLDHAHEPDAARGQAVHLLQPGERPGRKADFLRRADLRQQDRIGFGRRDGQQITVAGQRVQRVDAHDDLGAAEIERRQGLRHHVARQILVAGRDSILQVEDQAVGPALRGFGDHRFAVAGHVEQAAAEADVRGFGVHLLFSWNDQSATGRLSGEKGRDRKPFGPAHHAAAIQRICRRPRGHRQSRSLSAIWPPSSPRRLFCLHVAFDSADFGRSQTLLALLDREFNAVAFAQALVPLGLNGREVNEHVVTGLTGNEAVALLIAEPLDGTDLTSRHGLEPSCLIRILLTRG